MSKLVKNLLAKDLSNRLDGIEDCVLAVKNSLAQRATEGTSLAAAFEGIGGTNAVLWGADDFVSLVKEATELNKDEEDFEVFETRGGAMDGVQLTPARVLEISAQRTWWSTCFTNQVQKRRVSKNQFQVRPYSQAFDCFRYSVQHSDASAL